MRYHATTLLLALASLPAFAQVPISGTTVYTQDFNGLPNDVNGAIVFWDDNVTVPGWYIHRSNAAVRLLGTGGEYYCVDGSTVPNANPPAHGHYSAGSDANRGIAASSTTALGEISTIVIFSNTSPGAVQLKDLGYTGKIYRTNQAVTNLETTTVSYKVGPSAADLVAGLENTVQGGTIGAAAGFTPFNAAALNFTYNSTLDGADVQVLPPREFVQAAAAPLTQIILLPGQAIAIRWGNINDGGRDAIIGIDDVRASFEAIPCAIDATVSNFTRDLKGTPADASDDTYGFDLSVVGLGASPTGWQIADPAAYVSTGTYGTTRTYTGLPIPSAPLTLTITDRGNATCTDTVTVQAPVLERYVTATSSQGLTFTDAAVGAQNYARGENGDLGFTGGNGASLVRLQPDPNNSAKYFGINNSRPTVTTDAVNITLVDSVRVSVGLASYTTSGTSLEADDTLTVTVETTDDPVNGFWTPAATIVDGFITDGVALFDAIKVATPGINYPAAQPYPAADFPFVKFNSPVIPRGTATHARLVISGGNNSGSEFTLIDNVLFERAACLVTAASVITRDNKGDDNPANDEFSALVTVNAEANGASTGWVSDAVPAAGLYGNAVTFGPYPVSGGARTITLTDNLNASCKAAVTLTPPATVLAAEPVTDLVRNAGTDATTAADDRWEFTALVNATNGSTSWEARAGNAAGPIIGSGAYGAPVALTLPTDLNQVVFTDKADPTATTTLTLDLLGRDVAVGVSDINGRKSVLYIAPQPTGYWRQTGSALPAGAPASVLGLYSAVLNSGDSTAVTFDTESIDLSGTTGPTQFSATLTAFDNSAGSNFEGNDTFGLAVELTLEGNPTPVLVPLVPLLPGVDVSPANGVINGYTYVDLADYNLNRAQDEFNREGTAGELAMTSSFSFAYAIPKQFDDAGVLRNVIAARAIVSAVNNSGAEFYYLEDVNFSTGGGAADSDGDGLVDAWELQYFGNLNQNGTGDPDGDGQSNAAEQFAGTAPNDGNSVLAVTNVSRTGTNYSVTFNAVAGKKYAAEYATELNGQWIGIPGTLTATGASETLNGALPTPTPGRIFIRIRAVP
jgi:hypothetical protein